MPKAKLASLRITAVAALFLSAAHVPVAHSNPAYCLSRVSAYVRELDPILAEAKYSLTPIIELNDRYFPFVDCDPGPLLDAASRSRFFREASYDKGGEEYIIEFSSDEVVVTLAIAPTSEPRSFRVRSG